MSSISNACETSANITFSTVKKLPVSGKQAIVTKVLSWENGQVTKDASQSCISEGLMTRHEISDLKELEPFILETPQDTCLVLGVQKDSQPNVPVPIRSKSNAGPMDRTRTSEHIEMPPGRCLVVLDYDTPKDGQPLPTPAAHGETIKTFPELEGVAMLIVGSTSNGVRTPDGKTLTSGGIHIYFVLNDSRDFPKIKEWMHVRSWLGGEGRVGISKSGSLLTYDFFDGAVFDGSRLIFEASPILKGGLTASKREVLFIPGGDWVNVPEVTETERLRVRELVEAAKSAKAQEAATVRAAYRGQKVEELVVKNGGDRVEAEKTVTQFLDQQVISGLYPINTVNHGQITALDVLLRPKFYHNTECYDLDDPEDKRVRTIIFTDPQQMLHTFAHGGQKIWIKRPKIYLDPTQHLKTYQAMGRLLRRCDHALFVQGSELKWRDEKIVIVTRENVGPIFCSIFNFVVKRPVLNKEGELVRYVEKSIKPTADFFIGLLASIGVLDFPMVKAIVHAPYFFNGRVQSKGGYHADANVILGRDCNVILGNDAANALQNILERLNTFPFATELDRLGFVAVMLTGLQCHTMKLRPLVGITAPAAGSGKSLLAQAISILMLNEMGNSSCPSTDSTEFAKHLLGVLRKMQMIHIYDNMPLGYTLTSPELCALTTSEKFSGRNLGKTVNLEFDNVPTQFIVTGNSLKLGNDETRRFMLIELDARVADPSKRKFEGDFLEDWKSFRPFIINDLLTILNEYHKAGSPKQAGSSWGSFGEWCRAIRDPLMWLTGKDVAELRGKVEESAETQVLGEFIELWRNQFLDSRRTIAEAADFQVMVAGRMELSPVAAWLRTEFSERGVLNVRRAGNWLRKFEKRVCDGARFVRAGDRKKAVCWKLEFMNEEGCV